MDGAKSISAKMKKPAVMRDFSTTARSGPSTCHQALVKLVPEPLMNAIGKMAGTEDGGQGQDLLREQGRRAHSPN